MLKNDNAKFTHKLYIFCPLQPPLPLILSRMLLIWHDKASVRIAPRLCYGVLETLLSEFSQEEGRSGKEDLLGVTFGRDGDIKAAVGRSLNLNSLQGKPDGFV